MDFDDDRGGGGAHTERRRGSQIPTYTFRFHTWVSLKPESAKVSALSYLSIYTVRIEVGIRQSGASTIRRHPFRPYALCTSIYIHWHIHNKFNQAFFPLLHTSLRHRSILRASVNTPVPASTSLTLDLDMHAHILQSSIVPLTFVPSHLLDDGYLPDSQPAASPFQSSRHPSPYP